VATKSLVFPPQNLLDQITQTLRAQYERIEQIRQANCLSIGNTNVQILMLWLYNTDPNLREFQNQLKAKDQRTVEIIRGLASGLGLIPAEAILRSRIRTLDKYLNSPSQVNMTRDKATQLQGDSDPSRHERSINAYLSAYNTLGNHTFANTDAIVMDEFLPEGDNGVNKLKDVTARFDTYATTFELVDNSSANSATARDCKAVLRPITLRSAIPVGVSKDPSVMTYYAIRLKARARVLFSIFGDLDLKAYAAAQPFGSRIGPPLEETDLVRFASSPLVRKELGGLTGDMLGQVPNLPIGENDTTAKGWNEPAILGAYYAKLRPDGQTQDSPVLGPEDLERAYHAAMAPNPWETSRYNILNDTAVTPFQMTQHFDVTRRASIWAPVVAPGSNNTEELKDQLRELFRRGAGGSSVGSVASPQDLPNETLTALEVGLTKYLGDLRTGQGQDGDGLNVTKITDSFRPRLRPGAPPSGSDLLTFAAPIMTTPPLARTSWTPKIDEGRTGYSVKFVSLSSLAESSKRISTDGTATWTNAPSFDPEASDDVGSIKH
jgi:hypothetical protein